jgi:hypothetical protein
LAEVSYTIEQSAKKDNKEMIGLLKSIPLPVQVNMIFQDLKEELCGLSAGTVFLHIRNEQVATYGVRHRLENRHERRNDGSYSRTGVSEDHVHLFREMAAELVGRKNNWKRGTVSYKFAIKQGALHVSANFADRDDCIVD